MANCWFCYQDAGEAEYHEKCSRNFFGTKKAPELELNDQLLKDLASQTINERIAVTGVQPKLSVTLEKTKANSRLTIVGLWGDFILKPQHKDFRMMPEVEDLTMHLAGLFKIPVCRHTLLKASDGTLIYLAKRFDRVNGQKVHMEDFCQLSEFPTEYKYKSSYERIGKLILKYCTNTGLDALNYFELVLFCYLSGNNDMHLKNFAVLHEEGNIHLSPAYDLLNVPLVNPADTEEMALTLNARKSKLRLVDFTQLGERLNIPASALRNSLKKFSSRNVAVKELIGQSFLDKDAKQAFMEIWEKKQQIFK